MPYYQRAGKIDRRRMVYGFGRFISHPYRNYRGAEIFTDILDIQTGIGNGFLHGRIYDPSELGVSPPFPEYVRVDGEIYQFNPNDPPYNVNKPFNPNTKKYSGPSTTRDIPENIKRIDKKEIVGFRGMHGVGRNKYIQGVNPGIYREKDQPEDNYSPSEQPLFEQSSILSQQLRRDVVKGERLLSSFNQGTGEIGSGYRAFIGEKLENIKGDKDTFFINPANRPKDGDHKDL